MSRHGTLSLSRRPTNQGCSEDDDAKIDEALLDIKAERERRDQEQAAKQHRRFVYTSAISDGDDDDDEEHEDNGSGSSSNSHSHTHTHTHTQTDADADADDHATGAMDDILTSSPTSNSKGSSAECDESIRPWNPIYAAPGSPSPSPFHSFSHPRHQSIVEELASLKSSKSYTSTNSYFEDELQQESMSSPAVNSLPPLINVCSAGDYLHERTQKLRNSFVAEKKLVNP
jgi:ABC-type Zn2+ transport system substrate-binding protein/surface adhesin